jgi:hypothetical protein
LLGTRNEVIKGFCAHDFFVCILAHQGKCLVWNPPQVQTPFQNLFYLLQLDTAALLSVLEHSISDPDFVPTSIHAMRMMGGMLQSREEGGGGHKANTTSIPQQAAMDTLMLMLIGPDEDRFTASTKAADADDVPAFQTPFATEYKASTDWVLSPNAPHKTVFNEQHKGHAFQFLAKVMTGGRVEMPMHVVQMTILFLAKAPSDGDEYGRVDRKRAERRAEEMQERQETLKKFLDSLPPRAYAGLRTDLVVLLERSKFYAVLVWLHSRERDFTQAIECHLKDPLLCPQTFSYISHVMAQDLNTNERERVKDKVISRMHDLIVLSAEATAELIAEVSGFAECLKCSHDNLIECKCAPVLFFFFVGIHR